MVSLIAGILAAVLFRYAVRHREHRRKAFALAAGAVVSVVIAFVALPNLLYAQKVIGKLAMPAGLLWLGLAVATYVAWWRSEKLTAGFGAAVLVLYSAVGSPAMAGALLYSLERPFRDANPFAGEQLDAVFVHGGGTLIGPTGRARLADSGDRVLTAARVFHEREVRWVVTSGSSIAGIGRPRDVAAETANILTDLGVPSERIIQLPDPKNTSQEVAAYAELTDQRGWEKLGVVTSAWHMRRAQRLYDRNELSAEALPADFRGGLSWNGVISVIPGGGGFTDVHRACWEYLGAAVGR